MDPPMILDSFALLCFFHKEPGWEKVNTIPVSSYTAMIAPATRADLPFWLDRPQPY
jgi:PIN domain nuclease of toxin-antitoxin system